jgi:DNA-binding CsgD family transcriptional regulator
MAAAVAFVADPDRAIDIPDATLAELYHLTPAESAVVRELVLGRSVEEIAERLGIALSTARTHIKRILSKTETRRQADLIRLILLTCCR